MLALVFCLIIYVVMCMFLCIYSLFFIGYDVFLYVFVYWRQVGIQPVADTPASHLIEMKN